MSEEYYELIFAVQTKYPGETRHETALRYIREAESHCSPVVAKMIKEVREMSERWIVRMEGAAKDA